MTAIHETTLPRIENNTVSILSDVTVRRERGLFALLLAENDPEAQTIAIERAETRKLDWLDSKIVTSIMQIAAQQCSDGLTQLLPILRTILTFFIPETLSDEDFSCGKNNRFVIGIGIREDGIDNDAEIKKHIECLEQGDQNTDPSLKPYKTLLALDIINSKEKATGNFVRTFVLHDVTTAFQ